MNIHKNIKILTTIYLFIVLGLCFKLCYFSLPNKHPDEKAHYDAVEYYTNHFYPPKAEDPNISNTYSREGYSRLNETTTFHFISGRLASITSFINLKKPFNVRFFNFTLLIIIIIFFLYSLYKGEKILMLFVPFLLIPQFWYIFSYCNDDALSLFLSIISTFLLIKYKFQKKIVLTGFLLGLLSLDKTNYFIFCFFPIVILSVFWLLRERQIKKLILFIIPIMIVFGIRSGWDYYLYGTEKSEIIKLTAEEKARPDFKESNIGEKISFNEFKIYKKNDILLSYMLYDMGWFRFTNKSILCVLGQMNVFTYDEYYYLAQILLLLILGIILYEGFLSANGKLIMLATLIIALNYSASIYYSWTFDFQPQGRYILPSLLALGLCIYKIHSFLKKPFWVLVILFSILNLYSFYDIVQNKFIFFGKLDYPKELLGEQSCFDNIKFNNRIRKIDIIY